MANDDTFSANFNMFAGEEGLEYAQNVYGILKEMQMKLEALG